MWMTRLPLLSSYCLASYYNLRNDHQNYGKLHLSICITSKYDMCTKTGTFFYQNSTFFFFFLNLFIRAVFFFLKASCTQLQKTMYTLSVLSIRAEAGTMGPVTEVLCTGYCHKKIEGIKPVWGPRALTYRVLARKKSL